jgi:hypothetical protein
MDLRDMCQSIRKTQVNIGNYIKSYNELSYSNITHNLVTILMYLVKKIQNNENM